MRKRFSALSQQVRKDPTRSARVDGHKARLLRMMSAVAHNPSFAKKAGIPVSVGKEFAVSGKSYKKLPARRGK